MGGKPAGGSGEGGGRGEREENAPILWVAFSTLPNLPLK